MFKLLIMKALLVLIIAFTFKICPAQDNVSDKELKDVYGRYVEAVKNKAECLEDKIRNKTERMLTALSREETRIKGKLSKVNRQLSDKVFSSNDIYRKLAVYPESSIKFKEYIPHLDSIRTSLNFLQTDAEISALLKPKQINNAMNSIQSLEQKLAQVQIIQKTISIRHQQLKEALANAGLLKELKRFHKKAYYYTQQIKEYKQLLNDPARIEAKALILLQRLPAFSAFMKRNSQIASLFRLPENYGSTENLRGLQARADVMHLVQQRIDAGGPGAENYLQSSLQDAKSKMSLLKAKLSDMAGSSNNLELPDFKPNQQKTKSFMKRLEYGTNIQTAKANNYFPSTSDIGLSIGYKLNDKSVAGVGLCYKLGLGRDIRHIRLSHEGFGVRSFIDMKLKGSFFIAVGVEYNYYNSFETFQQLKDSDQWKQHALIGLSKKYKVSRKIKGEIKFLYDFFYKNQLPQTQPVVFRLGYKL